MKSKLEHIIEQKGIDQSARIEPLPGHEERFEMRLLQRQLDVKKKRNIPAWWIIAAAAAAIAIIVNIAIQEVNKADELMALNKAETNAEVMAMDALFEAKGGKQIPEVDQLDAFSQRILHEINKLELEYKKLESTLASGAEPERITDEMVRNYQFRIRLIEQLKQYLQIKEIQIKNNEKLS